MRRLNKELLKNHLIRRTEADLHDGRVGGVSVSLWQDGEEVFSHSFGETNERTLFRMASMTKPVTAVATMIAVERGLLSLDDPIEKYLPEFANMRVAVCNESGEVIGEEPARRSLTPRLLLAHSSGLDYDGPCCKEFSNMTDEERLTMENSVAACARMHLSFQPGESQGYSHTVAWDPLLTIIQNLTGEDYAEFITKEIFVPCGMVDTTYTPSDEQYSRMIPMHDFIDGKATTVELQKGWYTCFPNTHYLGCAGLYSTLADYIKFALMLQNGGEINGHRILSEKSVREIATPQLSESANPGGQPWGLAVRVIRGNDERLPEGAFGWRGAYGTHFWVDPTNRITEVYMKNSHFDRGHTAITAAHFEEDVMAALE